MRKEERDAEMNGRWKSIQNQQVGRASDVGPMQSSGLCVALLKSTESSAGVNAGVWWWSK